MAKNEDDKKDLTNRQIERSMATMFYHVGNAIGGQRPAGGFASVGPGLWAYGTHRDGRPGVLLGGKFVPITRKAALEYGFDSSLYGKGDGGGGGGGGGNNLNTRPDEDEEGLDKKPIRNKPRVPRGASWKQIVGAYFPRTREPRNDNQIKTMKEGGLVRGAGKAERGRGKGKMV